MISNVLDLRCWKDIVKRIRVACVLVALDINASNARKEKVTILCVFVLICQTQTYQTYFKGICKIIDSTTD